MHGCSDLDISGEAYLMGLLTPSQARAFEDHYLGCAGCAERLEALAGYVEAMRRAAGEIRDAQC
jgi:hypothetical protein